MVNKALVNPGKCNLGSLKNLQRGDERRLATINVGNCITVNYDKNNMIMYIYKYIHVYEKINIRRAHI